MVIVNYIGRTCNNLFQYTFARLVASRNGFNVVTPWNHPDFISFKEQTPSTQAGLMPITLDDTFRYPRDTAWLQEGRYKNRRIVVKGYFQYSEFYDPYKETIKSWMNLKPITEEHKDDIVFHLRLDDYERVTDKPVIDPVWYYSITQQLPKAKIYCVMDSPKAGWEHIYVQKIKGLFPGIEIRSSTAVEDFNFIRQFGTIICSNSSFCWWAAWLSNAKKVFTFRKWLTGSPMVTLAHTQGFVDMPGKYYWE